MLLLSGMVVGPALLAVVVQGDVTEAVRGWVTFFNLVFLAGAVCLCIGLFRMVAMIDQMYDRHAQVQEVNAGTEESA